MCHFACQRQWMCKCRRTRGSDLSSLIGMHVKLLFAIYQSVRCLSISCSGDHDLIAFNAFRSVLLVHQFARASARTVEHGLMLGPQFLVPQLQLQLHPQFCVQHLYSCMRICFASPFTCDVATRSVFDVICASE